ncbi:arsenical-resistance protein [Kwoniella shandongensis]|uniref:Arsenical-resistance protein n=1 Tax=Kwoniella shandongensis TaxID=1734106 RepID=A0A5M6C1P2_9TREE|nr:arsenical-resistance protein [Kwoniella shandongensis]KAA5529047.1 arsenical-resistance protein [Kwoniella shandongensis]
MTCGASLQRQRQSENENEEVALKDVHHTVNDGREEVRDGGLEVQGIHIDDKRSRGARSILLGLSWLDRFLAAFVLLAMILGVIIGKFANNVEAVLTGTTLNGVSIPIVIGLLVMMWPILTKVQYERLPVLFRTVHIWRQVWLSLVLNWIIGPFIMLAVAWATLPDLPTYRTGVIMVGLARCIAMVMIWNHLARGDVDYCAILVIINSILQIILYSPMSLFFVNVISKENDALKLEYGQTAIAVLIYLGIPLAAGVVTRWLGLMTLGKDKFEHKFLPYFGPLALIGLLYTIILIFAEQATRILDNIGEVFRVFVPMICYFVIMWTGTFFLVYILTKRKGGSKRYGYKMAVVQSFTAGSNNFELAIAVCIAVYGVDSDQALAATIGPLVEVPVLLGLTYVSLYFERKLNWGEREPEKVEGGGV